ncbi:MAG: domain containing protein [Chloroflexi bacterium]|nr:domain containing protein [Chloroflexota bacterium]
MSLLTQVESLIEGIIEGSFRRVLSPRLQPLEIARVLERLMLDQKLVGAQSVEVPNFYVARLHPVDFDRFASFRDSVERETAAHLDRRAVEEGCRPIGPIRVELALDPRVTRSFVKGEARFEDASCSESSGLSQTRRFDTVLAAVAARGLALITEDGEELRAEKTIVTIGRGMDNSLVVRDLRVSRHHARIEPDGDGWIVQDMESTNGTYLEGQRVQIGRFSSNAEISLGGYRITVRPT